MLKKYFFYRFAALDKSFRWTVEAFFPLLRGFGVGNSICRRCYTLCIRVNDQNQFVLNKV